jgi:hypothetical protein
MGDPRADINHRVDNLRRATSEQDFIKFMKKSEYLAKIYLEDMAKIQRDVTGSVQLRGIN